MKNKKRMLLIIAASILTIESFAAVPPTPMPDKGSQSWWSWITGGLFD